MTSNLVQLDRWSELWIDGMSHDIDGANHDIDGVSNVKWSSTLQFCQAKYSLLLYHSQILSKRTCWDDLPMKDAVKCDIGGVSHNIDGANHVKSQVHWSLVKSNIVCFSLSRSNEIDGVNYEMDTHTWYT